MNEPQQLEVDLGPEHRKKSDDARIESFWQHVDRHVTQQMQPLVEALERSERARRQAQFKR